MRRFLRVKGLRHRISSNALATFSRVPKKRIPADFSSAMAVPDNLRMLATSR
jgi:hypothetical protein